jgi:hypothetical protein
MHNENRPPFQVVKCGIFCSFLLWFVAGGRAEGQAVGICLHASSPEAAGSTVQAFEYTRTLKFDRETRFFLPNGRSVNISHFRLRGVVLYPTSLNVDNPELPGLLASYPAIIGEYPATRPYLEPLVGQIQKVIRENEMRMEEAANIKVFPIGGRDYQEAEYAGVEDGKLVVRHRGGVAKIDISTLKEEDLPTVRTIKHPAPGLRAERFADKILFNARFHRLTNDGIVLEDDGGEVEFGLDRLTASEVSLINGWSDGTWRIGDPGFTGWDQKAEKYASVLLSSGREIQGVKIEGVEDEKIKLLGSGGQVIVPIEDVASLRGCTEEDRRRLDRWADEIFETRLRAAERSVKHTPWVERERRGPLRVVNASAKILQILNQESGVLAVDLTGEMLTGTRRRFVITEASAVHPATGKTVVRELDRRVEEDAMIERGHQGLVFIEGDIDGFVDGQAVRAKSITHVGTYNYVDVRGAERTVMKFSVD